MAGPGVDTASAEVRRPGPDAAGAPGGRRPPLPEGTVPARAGRRRSDAWPVLVLLVVPLVVFVVPALLGHPAIAGDNNLQNFPLRVLSGRLIAQGQLPLWNTTIWSGNPLLGGLNAGALYPGTLVFAVLPPVTAWVLNLLVVYWAAGLGLYALLRQYRLVPVASFLGAATYAWSGAMAGQLVHLPIVQGLAWMPLLLLGQLRLSWSVLGTGPAAGGRGAVDRGAVGPAAEGTPTAPEGASGPPWRWVALLAVVGGLVLLTGEPRGMAEGEIVALVTCAWLVLRPYGGAVALAARGRYLGYTALAAVWAAALGAVQLLPGLHFIGYSQRASESYAYFGTGSLHPQWSVLLLAPDLFGGDGILHQPTYFNSYNLPEVTGYVGLLPLVAAFALATVTFGRRRARGSADWGLWLVLAGLGLLLAFGEYTWLGALFGHIPYFDRLRLQSRNIAITDLGLAGLLAFWAHRLVTERAPPESAGWRRRVTLLPAAAAALLCVVALAVPVRLEVSMGASALGAALGDRLRPWLVAQLAVAVAVLALVGWWRRVPAVARRRLLCAVVVVDLVLFTASSSTGLGDGHVVVQPGAQPAASVLGRVGRFAVYDTTALNSDELSEVGQPDLNVFTGRPSVQGYGSIVDDAYATATGTHDLDTLDPCALARGVFVPLRLSALLTLPVFVAPPVWAVAPTPPACPGAPAPGTAARRTWFFGQRLMVTGADLVGHPAGPGARAPALRVGLLGPRGGVVWPRQVVRPRPDGWAVSLDTPTPAAGLVVTGPARRVTDQSTVRTASGVRYVLDGVLQDALSSAGWRADGWWRQYGVFRHAVAPSPVWLADPVAGASVRQVHSSDTGAEVDQVHAPRPVTVVRSVSFQAGWRVEARSATGTTVALPVTRRGVVQAVTVPAGSWQLTFLYRPVGLDAGLVASGLGLAALAGAAVVWLAGRRRRRGRPWPGASAP